MRQHYLEGVRHEATLEDGSRVVTLWTSTRSEADRLKEALRSEGAQLARTFTEGRANIRVVGYWGRA